MQVVVECLDLDEQSAPGASGPSAGYAEMDLSGTRYVPHNLIDQLVSQLVGSAERAGREGKGEEIEACRRGLEESLARWQAFVEREAEIVGEWCAADQAREMVSELIAREARNSATGVISGEDGRLLAHKILTKLRELPFGQRLHRAILASSGEGYAAKMEADRVFGVLSLQLVQRTRGRDAVLPEGTRWTDFGGFVGGAQT